MARDRQRAKQRKARRAAQDNSAQSARTKQPFTADDRPTTEPPDAIEEASADAEEAKLAITRGQAEPEPDLEFSDVAGAGDALDEGAVAVRGEPSGGRSAGVVRPGAELPREGNRFFNFIRACWAELQRVQWPDRRQVSQATTVVLVFVVIAGSYLGLMDAIFSRVVNAIL